MRINVVGSIKSDTYKTGNVIARVEVWGGGKLLESTEKSFARRSAARKFIARVAEDAYDRLES